MRERFADPASPVKELWAYLEHATFDQAMDAYQAFMEDPNLLDEDIAELGVLDRYFLLVYLLERPDVVDPWLYARCREVQADPDSRLDLWARFHYKSTIITYAGIIQEILLDPEITIGIFAITRDVARAFLRQIKQEFEQNDLLKALYPEVLWQSPENEAPKWSENDGIIVRRTANPKESTVEAWGLVDNMPTSRHFSLRVYDDMVNEKSVTTPDMILKTTERWELSISLGHGIRGNREWYAGTRYLFGDSYETIIRRKAAKPRIYPATDNGELDGTPVLMSTEEWAEIKSKTSLKTLACQQLLDPRKGSDASFEDEWLRWYEVRPLTLNVLIVVDPARTKKKTSDRTGIAVIGIDYAYNKYVLDGYLHRMGLSDRWRAIKNLRSKWRRQPGIGRVEVGYEKYGADADFEYFEEQMKIDGEQFPIEQLTWTRDAPDSYIDRVQRLEPDFRNGRLFLPYNAYRPQEPDETDAHYEARQGKMTSLQKRVKADGGEKLLARPILRKDEDGKLYDLIETMIDEEYRLFPAVHVDWLDALSRMYDMKIRAPIQRQPEPRPRKLAAR